MSSNPGTKYGPNQHRGEALQHRLSDGAIVQVFYSPRPFIHNGVTISPIASYIVTDGTTYTAITDAQYESGYTPASFAHNMTGR